MHYIEPSIERLGFLEGDETIIYEDHKSIVDVVNKPIIHKTHFLSWMQANKKYPEGKILTKN
jgi:hypothetical protein